MVTVTTGSLMWLYIYGRRVQRVKDHQEAITVYHLLSAPIDNNCQALLCVWCFLHVVISEWLLGYKHVSMAYHCHQTTAKQNSLCTIASYKYKYMWQSQIHNRILFHHIYQAHHQVWRSIVVRSSFHLRQCSYAMCKHMNIWCVYEACMSSALSRSSTL